MKLYGSSSSAGIAVDQPGHGSKREWARYQLRGKSGCFLEIQSDRPRKIEVVLEDGGKRTPFDFIWLNAIVCIILTWTPTARFAVLRALSTDAAETMAA